MNTVTVTTKRDLTGKQALVVGGTNGIGSSIAKQLAEMGASVTIVGRNAERGKIMVDTMSSLSPAKAKAKYNFIQADLSLMKEATRAAEQYAKQNKKLNMLVFTAGVIANKERQQTAEGVESDIAASYLERFVILHVVKDMLSSGDRVLNIAYAGGVKKEELLNDLNGEKDYSAFKQHQKTVIANDVMALEFSRRLKPKNVDVFALNPGMVDTQIRRNSNILPAFVIRALEAAMKLFVMMKTPDDYAKVAVDVATNPKWATKGGTCLINAKGEAIPVPAVLQKLDNAKKLFEVSYKLSGLSQRYWLTPW